MRGHDIFCDLVVSIRHFCSVNLRCVGLFVMYDYWFVSFIALMSISRVGVVGWASISKTTSDPNAKLI